MLNTILSSEIKTEARPTNFTSIAIFATQAAIRATETHFFLLIKVASDITGIRGIRSIALIIGNTFIIDLSKVIFALASAIYPFRIGFEGTEIAEIATLNSLAYALESSFGESWSTHAFLI